MNKCDLHLEYKVREAGAVLQKMEQSNSWSDWISGKVRVN